MAMDGGGQQRATDALKSLRTGGQTNLWAGLQTALEVCTGQINAEQAL